MALLNEGNYESVEFYTENGELIPKVATQKDLMMRDDDYAEKLAWGEYGPTVKEKLTVDTPTCKESLPVDRVTWRREFAEKVALTIIGGMTSRAHSADKNLTLFEAVASDAVSYADALLAELETK